MPRGVLQIEWCLILIIIITTVVTYNKGIIITIISNLIFFTIILIIYIMTICLWVILLLVFMIATFRSHWLINYLNVIGAVDSSTPIIMLTLSDYKGVSQTQNETLGLPYGSSNIQDKREFGSVPLRNITFELQISHIQCYLAFCLSKGSYSNFLACT